MTIPFRSSTLLLFACSPLLLYSFSQLHFSRSYGLVAAATCASQGPPPGPKTQGRAIQGRAIQGRAIQGRAIQGRAIQGTGEAISTVQQVLLNGAVVADLRLSGTVLVGSMNGKKISGADFVGATVVQQDPDGTTFQATISAVQPDPQDDLCEVQLYTLMVKSESGTLENMCDPDPWNQRWAIPVSGGWNQSGAHVDTKGFMFACTSGVVAKCIRWGYRPWKQINGRSLADYHQACTRMARADYCGDGVTHTENGTLIDMYDRLGIQKKSPVDLKSPPLFFDAAWTPSGAYCIAKERWLKLGEAPALLSCLSKFQLLSLKLDLNLKKPLGKDGLLGSLIRESPVDKTDLCVVSRNDMSPDQILMDNKSRINIKLTPDSSAQ